jgi:hypothetical protein
MDSSRSLQAVRVRRIHVDTLPRPLRDEASQGSTASAAAQAEWPSEKDSCRHAARLVRDGASQDSTASAAAQAGWPSGAACQWSNEIG